MSGTRGDLPAADTLEQSLLGLRSLIDSTVAMHRARSAADRLVLTLAGGYPQLLEVAEELIASARAGIDVVHAHGPTGERRGARVERDLLAGAPESVAVRLLTAPDLVDEDFVREQTRRGRPVAVRVAGVPPLQGLVVDGEIALVAFTAEPGQPSSLIRLPEVVDTLQTLFESVWRSAVPAEEWVVLGDPARARFVRQILEALRAGVTDEVAARELSVSVRTYRRHVAEVMNLLGATSRFQAGARAAELGLLSREPAA